MAGGSLADGGCSQELLTSPAFTSWIGRTNHLVSCEFHVPKTFSTLMGSPLWNLTPLRKTNS